MTAQRKRKPAPRFYLRATPLPAKGRPVGKRWPRNAEGAVVPVGVLKDGEGWVVGLGDPMTAAQVEDAKDGMVDEWGPFSFEVYDVDHCRICGEYSHVCDGTRHARVAVGDEDNRGGAPRP